ncbi:hypothetical protein [Parasitella parasitica]|uniref:Velvet domain-containing protein n=1 Tax=Parasitella parasitica TaxID=35722 RepID=A0A0B7NFW7_9FUNG|nr:hypothetical protein [Parasitella parasitica]
MDESVSYHFATVKQRREDRHEIEYQLTLRQQPKQSRMSDRRPIDPPPIVQLKVIDSKLPSAEKNAYLQNPYYFMYASLMAADLDEELHLLRDGKTRSTTGSVVSSLYHLKDIDNTDAGFFVFPDLFPGMEESTFLSRSFADQGLKIRIRKELRQRRKLSKISDTEERDTNSITPSPTTTTATTTSTKKAKTYNRTSDNSPSTSSSNSNLTASTTSVSTPPLPTATVSSANSLTSHHYRIDLPPNPTRYISYSSKQPEIWGSSPQLSQPLNSSGSGSNRHYAQESSFTSLHQADGQQPYIIHSDSYHSPPQSSIRYSSPTQPRLSSSTTTHQETSAMSMAYHNNSSRNPPLFYCSSNYSHFSLTPPPPPTTSTQQLPHPSLHPSQHLPPPP